MIVESGQVVGIEGDFIVVQTARQSACDSCSVNKGCGSPVLARLAGSRYSRIRVVNSVDARVGDTVRIGIEESGLLKSALLAYAMPLLCVPLFVGVGSLVAGAQLADGAAILLAIAGLSAGIGAARVISARLVRHRSFHPVALSVEASSAGSAFLVS